MSAKTPFPSPFSLIFPKDCRLAGGVGGARLVDGLAQVLPAQNLTIIVNTGDDFEHLGLKFVRSGHGVLHAGGDRQPRSWLGAHLMRHGTHWKAWQHWRVLTGFVWVTAILHSPGAYPPPELGEPLSQIARDSARLGVNLTVLPMSDDLVQTLVYTDEGVLPFRSISSIAVASPGGGFSFEGADQAHPALGVMEALGLADMVVICPSKSLVSIDPILAIPGIKSALGAIFVVAVSPIIGGQTVKGPLLKCTLRWGLSLQRWQLPNITTCS